MPNNFFNRDLPRIAQCRGDGFDGLSPLVLIALVEMVAFPGKLIAQTCGDVTDPTRFEWRLAAAEACLVSPSADRANRHLRLGLGIIRRAIQLEQERKIMREDDDLAMRSLSHQALSYGLPVHVVE
ncbi:MAG: hypothetical protein U1E07_17220 [Hydrocarboniphaga sp.]|uniref:Uncharacterized protein n=1 Tax=Hydrocarboniphaga effusa AP103 TaxID=1172194 RepID=I7Z8N9_9GAMM|nr:MULTISPECIES: hypothetical protein [Hydrocarboniphaga]EIT68002.1 hypothetical protein WQQ_44370 [Hydrocarboniphaga effusa AP103]MDZ4080146.1 hypothetical protein [Hydrocarboniphaga sp.]